MLNDMQSALASTTWLAGETYSLSDIALIAYADRLERLGMEGWWQARYPAVSGWLVRSRSRQSYDASVTAYIPAAMADADRAIASKSWPAIAGRLGIA
jgi:glutathione S-transferase